MAADWSGERAINVAPEGAMAAVPNVGRRRGRWMPTPRRVAASQQHMHVTVKNRARPCIRMLKQHNKYRATIFFKCSASLIGTRNRFQEIRKKSWISSFSNAADLYLTQELIPLTKMCSIRGNAISNYVGPSRSYLAWWHYRNCSILINNSYLKWQMNLSVRFKTP